MSTKFRECLSMSTDCATFWAGWGAIATAVVGLITVAVACLAWQTSRQAAKIAANQHQVALDLRAGRARIIGRLLLHEVNALHARTLYYAGQLDAVAHPNGERKVGWAKVRVALTPLLDPLLPGAEGMQEHLHNLPDALGADLATVISHSRDINQGARHVLGNIQESGSSANGYPSNFTYTGRAGAMRALRNQLEFIMTILPDFIAEFRQEVLGPLPENDVRE